MMNNRQIRLISRPEGMPGKHNFEFTESEVPGLEEGQALVRALYLSVDPYMRGRMNDQKSYVPPYKVGEIITGGVVGQIAESKTSEFKKGEYVVGNLGWQEYSVVKAGQVTKVDPSLAPVTTALGILGMPGLTAYFGLLDIGQPKEGETVVVSGAAGAVGTAVGQIAKLKGARVVGIAGSEEKADYLKKELGFDVVVNYRSEGDIHAAMKEACPDGVDVYFDNVGGEISDAVLSLINKGARIPLCGQIALYNLEKPDNGPRIQGRLLTNSALMKGFIVGDYSARYPEGMKDLASWLKAGKLKYRETIVEGFDQTIEAFLGLFKGENIGKQLVNVADAEKTS
ncbi:NADP-dependent oxidoreductase [Paenibacillus sp. FJAT-26967]|uniref:NADP-dependent oxidoreductase n=1 Tax=Paenibacillus sp. FJAT-26967 TaxID=1729690 RepID=UPI000837AC9C|nr:NADP-dependent oxidoreductase [Paenibacillus sp. FJAT-26967]